ncbi:MAG: TIGR04452 family lipoprotein [Spirochaetia bacterium]|nr:TIGR04452 family lipoprotein [Spirochaetia bacterium]
MKKMFFTLILSVSILASGNSCILFNVLGLNPGHEKGSVAAGRIQDEAILIDLIFSIGTRISILSFLADKMAGIDPGAYYKTREVDACIDAMWGFWGWFFSAGIAAALEDACSLQPDNIILDP